MKHPTDTKTAMEQLKRGRSKPLSQEALELSKEPTPRLEIVPTGVAVSWPSHSPESRLQQALSERGEVSVVVRQWLDAAELDQALRTITETRDSQLRSRFNSLQCNDRIWKEALHRLIERADVVVMDLSGFTERNRGCAYELGRLVNHVPLERVLLLIDDETDLAGLRQLLCEVTAGHSGVATAQQLRVFHLGSQPIRRDHESVYEWQRRATSPIDAERLIGLLCDAACANRPRPNPTAIRWSRPGYRSAPVV
jgi:hypothetical protein